MHMVPAVDGEAGERLWQDEVEPKGGEVEEDVSRAAEELHETVHRALVGCVGPGTWAATGPAGLHAGVTVMISEESAIPWDLLGNQRKRPAEKKKVRK